MNDNLTRTNLLKTASCILFFCLAAIILIGCANQPKPSSTTTDNQVAIANPASEKCITDGGIDKVLMGPGGQYGVCLFSDGSVCDEWAYFRGECKKGECTRSCKAIGTRSEGWYDCNNKLLFFDLCANETAETAGSC